MPTTPVAIPTDTWLPASWERYLQVSSDPAYQPAKGYYFHECLRIEMSPVGFDHSRDHSSVTFAIHLFCVLQSIKLALLDNCSFRQTGQRECQPDLAAYIGDRAQLIPPGTNVVDLDIYATPDIAIEIGKTTIIDDQTVKRALYEEMGVKEYWTIDVERCQIVAWRMIERGSQQTDASEILPGFQFSLLATALHQSRTSDQSQVGAWLMQQFQPAPPQREQPTDA